MLVLHENKVPDFDKAVSILIDRAWRTTPNFIPVIVEYLGARTTRARRSHPPKVIICRNTNDAIVRKARDFFPDIRGLIVRMIDRDQQLIFVDAEILGQQFPRKWDRFVLEVIAKGEVAEHLEKRMVTRCVTHVVEIVVLAACAHAFLRRCCAFVVAGL